MTNYPILYFRDEAIEQVVIGEKKKITFTIKNSTNWTKYSCTYTRALLMHRES